LGEDSGVNDFTNVAEHLGLRVKLWRGERMCLVGMDVSHPEDDFVGFSIEVRHPGDAGFVPLHNRLHFSYSQAPEKAVNGYRNYDSTEAPFQKFRWIHFPRDPQGGEYIYRVTKQHMRRDGTLCKGASVQVSISLNPVTYHGFLDVGFSRNFASSQAYCDKYGNNQAVIPSRASEGLRFPKLSGDIYRWLGFEAYDLIFDFLHEAVENKDTDLDVFAYDLNEPDIVALLEKMGARLRAVIDNSGSHAARSSAESQAAARLAASAGRDRVKRMHFRNLQHNKALILKRNGKPYKVLFGSTNFSFRGIYVQANNVLVARSAEAAELFERVFELAFHSQTGFDRDPISSQWHLVHAKDKPRLHFCFSPHSQPNLSLDPLAQAIDQAASSVFFSIAFLYQERAGPTRKAIDRLMKRNLFSYGISDKHGALHLKKPDSSIGLVDFAYLAAKAPEPFKSEWSGGGGIHEHHKFVVTDFNLPGAKVFTGSSNLSPSGEKGNGDNLIMIEDSKIATAYAIEALRIFDHLHFRSRLQSVAKRARTQSKQKDTLMLRRPAALSGEAPWFEVYYRDGAQEKNDRELFSR